MKAFSMQRRKARLIEKEFDKELDVLTLVRRIRDIDALKEIFLTPAQQILL